MLRSYDSTLSLLVMSLLTWFFGSDPPTVIRSIAGLITILEWIWSKLRSIVTGIPTVEKRLGMESSCA